MEHEYRTIEINGQLVVQKKVPSWGKPNLNHGGETWITIETVGLKTGEIAKKQSPKPNSISYPKYGYEKVGVYCYQRGGKQGKVYGTVPVARKHKTTAHHQGDLPKPASAEWKRSQGRGAYHLHDGQWMECKGKCRRSIPIEAWTALNEKSPFAKRIRS